MKQFNSSCIVRRSSFRLAVVFAGAAVLSCAHFTGPKEAPAPPLQPATAAGPAQTSLRENPPATAPSALLPGSASGFAAALPPPQVLPASRPAVSPSPASAAPAPPPAPPEPAARSTSVLATTMPLPLLPTLPTTVSAAAELTSRTLGGLLYQLVAATESHDPRLLAIDSEMKQIEAEMKDIWASNSWEFEATRQTADYDATRHSAREGTTLGLDGRPRRAFNLFGHYDREERDMILALKRSFGSPDHESYVKIVVRRLDKMDAVIRKQEIRRTIHLATLQAVLDILYRQTVLPLVDERRALAQRKLALLSTFQQTGEALRKDLLEAQNQLHALDEESLIHRSAITLNLSDLRAKTGLANLVLPTTAPLAADPATSPVTLHEPDVTSRALAARTDYIVSQLRVDQAERAAKYVAWYWPRVDFEVSWNKYSDRRNFLDDSRLDRGHIFGTELRVNVPLSLPYRGWKRYESFRAMQEGFRQQQEQLRLAVTHGVLKAHLDLQQARLHYRVAQGELERATEEARATTLVAEHLPEEIQGTAELKQLEARLKLLDARTAFQTAAHDLVLAQAHWDYQTGNSPIDEAAAPYEELDRRAAEKKGWLRWWTSLMK